MSKRKNPSSNDAPNADFCEFLMELSEYEKNVNRNIHKYNAYKNAASVLASLNKKIESGDEAKKLKGIGEKIAKKIDEFLQSGKLKKLENIHQDIEAKTISLFTRVSGIGPVKAADLFKGGLRTLKDLKNNRDKLNHHQIIGLKYFEDFEKKIPRSEIIAIENKMKENIYKLDPKFTVTICGSFRRGKSESGILYKLRDDLPYRRLDIRLVPCEKYYCAVLYFTGSDVFNKAMRTHALEKGFTLNEYSLRPIGSTGLPGEPVPLSSEEEIFEYIDYPYKKPEERNK
ncbi:hypothetical protein K1T71_008727 [Dendrolimus kikuchii]|uniref:Uncharacterized protein n=1 Tax=Dendrolimus kikuchii TaxID=765133 RepID=A0ACC1CV99_9NEOP|nr:hypothetical protein K1T71_008727 [Dendrolimus kikuchii]